jgi:hypothetical protein
MWSRSVQAGAYCSAGSRIASPVRAVSEMRRAAWASAASDRRKAGRLTPHADELPTAVGTGIRVLRAAP